MFLLLTDMRLLDILDDLLGSCLVAFTVIASEKEDAMLIWGMDDSSREKLVRFSSSASKLYEKFDGIALVHYHNRRLE